MNKKTALIITLLLIFPSIASAEGTIGVDSSFSIQPIQFLSGNPPYDDAFNYFFTIEIFCGLVALWLRLLIKTIRM